MSELELSPMLLRLDEAAQVLGLSAASIRRLIQRKELAVVYIGKNVRVPSSWFGATGVALGLSRAEMDERLLRRASAAGTASPTSSMPTMEEARTRVCMLRTVRPEREGWLLARASAVRSRTRSSTGRWERATASKSHSSPKG